MLKLYFGEVLEHTQPVLLELPYEARDIQIRVHTITQREVICFCENLNTMWESTLPAHGFLERCTGSTSAVNFSIKETDINKFTGKSHDMWFHDIRGVRSGKTPDNVACRVTYMRTHAMVSKIEIIDECFLEDRDEFIKSGWQEKTASAKLSKCQAPTMPCRVSLRWSK